MYNCVGIGNVEQVNGQCDAPVVGKLKHLLHVEIESEEVVVTTISDGFQQDQPCITVEVQQISGRNLGKQRLGKSLLITDERTCADVPRELIDTACAESPFSEREHTSLTTPAACKCIRLIIVEVYQTRISIDCARSDAITGHNEKGVATIILGLLSLQRDESVQHEIVAHTLPDAQIDTIVGLRIAINCFQQLGTIMLEGDIAERN